jgi:hypothetical protein
MPIVADAAAGWARANKWGCRMRTCPSSKSLRRHRLQPRSSIVSSPHTWIPGGAKSLEQLCTSEIHPLRSPQHPFPQDTKVHCAAAIREVLAVPRSPRNRVKSEIETGSPLAIARRHPIEVQEVAGTEEDTTAKPACVTATCTGQSVCTSPHPPARIAHAACR